MMTLLLFSVGVATVMVMVLWFAQRTGTPPQVCGQSQNPLKPNPVIESLATELSDVVLLRGNTEAFDKSIEGYWAQQEREVTQAAIVQPHNASELAKVVAFLRREYDMQCLHKEKQFDDVLFAIRGGGRSPVTGSASASGEVSVGVGCQWIDVSRILDEEGLNVVGGRSSEVGVAGFTLEEDICFFTPQFGLGCSNVLEYEVVLASGEIITATASSYPDISKALKGGSDNFCVVTRFTLRCFPSTDIWFGFIHAPGSQSTKALTAVHEAARRADSKMNGTDADPYAAGAITCFNYVQAMGIRVISVYLGYTKVPEISGQWPKSGYAKLWRYWSDFKIHSQTSASNVISSTSPAGQRWPFATTTIKNDLSTIMATYAIFDDSIATLPKIKGFFYTLNMQPLLPSWVKKGEPSIPGISESTSDALIIVSFSLRWDRAEDDSQVSNTIRKVIECIDAAATEKGISHPYRYLNYCANCQRPLEGYGEKNFNFLRDVSRAYDPDGLFQRGCRGGFKLESTI